MKKTSKPYEIVYISSALVPTTEDGEVVMYLAMDDYSEIIFAPVISKIPKTTEDIMENMVKLFNGINENYDRNIHSQSTIYVTNYPENLHSFMKAVILKEDSIVYDPDKTEKKIEPFWKGVMESF